MTIPVHLCILWDFKDTACQTLRMLRFNQNAASNPKSLARRILAGRLQSKNATIAKSFLTVKFDLICMEPVSQDNISALNVQKLLPNIAGFITVSLLGVFTFLSHGPYLLRGYSQLAGTVYLALPGGTEDLNPQGLNS